MKWLAHTHSEEACQWKWLFRYVTKGAESEQPVGAAFYQWMGCRDHAGIICFLHCGSWQAQGGPVYICRDQRKCVFHNMGHFKFLSVELLSYWERSPGFNLGVTTFWCLNRLWYLSGSVHWSQSPFCTNCKIQPMVSKVGSWDDGLRGCKQPKGRCIM